MPGKGKTANTEYKGWRLPHALVRRIRLASMRTKRSQTAIAIEALEQWLHWHEQERSANGDQRAGSSGVASPADSTTIKVDNPFRKLHQ